ncbi:hypothetical protein NHF46_24010 [Arthrobacter alpinus]|nr:hypothetical protein [Arthrobacter alpinus]
MTKNITLRVSGIVLIGLFLVWQLVRTADFYREWAGNNDFLGLLGVVLGWALLASGVGIIVKALASKNESPKESGE